jgi:hypothetical protein
MVACQKIFGLSLPRLRIGMVSTLVAMRLQVHNPFTMIQQHRPNAGSALTFHAGGYRPIEAQISINITENLGEGFKGQRTMPSAKTLGADHPFRWRWPYPRDQEPPFVNRNGRPE